MSVFTAVYRTTKPYIQHLVIFGSSYGLGWASIPMYFITGRLWSAVGPECSFLEVKNTEAKPLQAM